ncbi:ABC transporter ATP-binding protein [Vallitalea guaymasensis]|uniref:ABC transporter ATP-binding protein n=1 Tax=Vallitalea guaymasensis TaxID=1185412 RepID=UPI002729929E|nr:ABC transporter ATP-binding protein [Vallitalea guaymasensis]
MQNELLKMEKITKVYPSGIVANDGVDFSIREGEIHAICGENGAGKSTLMKILFGLHTPEEGKITLRGEEIHITSPTVAIEYGIGMVHQHFMLVPSLTVAENMVLGVEPKKGLFIDMDKAIKTTEELSNKYNLHVDPKAKVEDIPVGIKQKVEILKALLRGAKILILDEPTAVLTPQETKELFNQLKLLKEKGHTIIFISHKLNEVKELCDRITVMRNGKSMGVHNTSDVSEEDISRLMVGRDVILRVEKDKASPKEAVLNVKDLVYVNELGKKAVNGISFSVRKGEILGVAGVEGNGQRELVESITGLDSPTSGSIKIGDDEVIGKTIKQIRRLGTSHIPEDRMTYGVAGDVSIEQNVISDKYDTSEFNGKILLKTKTIKDKAIELIKEYKVKCNTANQKVRMLSGGNIQKVVVAREFSGGPKLLIANQPTRGIDVGATEFIRKRLVELRDEGTAVLLISADLNEVMELSDSLIVMYGGEIVAYFEDTSTLTEEELGLYMLGVKKQTSEEIGGVINA